MKLESTCPLGPVEAVRLESYGFYHREKIVTGEDRWRPPLDKLKAGEAFTHRQKVWLPQPFVKHKWQLAPDDAEYAVPSKLPLPSPRHIHTSFDYCGHAVHIDFLRFVNWGPLSGIEHFIGFVDGELKSRGGRRIVVPGAYNRGWPFVLRVGDGAIVIHEFSLSPKRRTFKDVSFWSVKTQRRG